MYCNTHCACSHSEKDYNTEFDYFLRGKESLRMDVKVPEMARLSKEQVQNLHGNNPSRQIISFMFDTCSSSHMCCMMISFLTWLIHL